MPQAEYKLTRYSHGAGCGCKISPAVLAEILGQARTDSDASDARLIVGHAQRDDAAVYDLGDGTAVISTTDFFMPIVDDPVDFGRIAAVNALSDVYAMGGTPLVAIAILGWPVDQIPASVAGQVLEGARVTCREARIPLGGGHSIDSPEPIFGLAVTGRVSIDRLKRNNGALPGDVLYLTKSLGVGMLTTAQKQGKLKPEHLELARSIMLRLNTIGEVLGGQPGVHALTDVTGFGLAGHLIEMCQASQVHAQVHFASVPILSTDLERYHLDGCIPGGTRRNFASYGKHLGEMTDFQRDLLCDPQTSGGLLVAVAPEGTSAFETVCQEHSTTTARIGVTCRPSPSQAVVTLI
ncbi:MAG: selenide, water dikinase SelD [Saprospiraceae bacterium]|nr:selenide, water dikinase SelD [Saprospiraceae bacterium]